MEFGEQAIPEPPAATSLLWRIEGLTIVMAPIRSSPKIRPAHWHREEALC